MVPLIAFPLDVVALLDRPVFVVTAGNKGTAAREQIRVSVRVDIGAVANVVTLALQELDWVI